MAYEAVRREVALNAAESSTTKTNAARYFTVRAFRRIYDQRLMRNGIAYQCYWCRCQCLSNFQQMILEKIRTAQTCLYFFTIQELFFDQSLATRQLVQ